MRTDWMADAACAGSELDFYEYTNDTSHGEQADTLDWTRLGPLVETCAKCPVLEDCAEYAMREGGLEQYGVWAGTTATQRIRVARTYSPVGNVLSLVKENVAEARKRAAQLKLEGVA